jgi:hypothetical protein
VRLLELSIEYCAQLEEATDSSLGRARVRALKPSQNTMRRVEANHHNRSAPLHRTPQSPPFGGITDIGAPLKQASVVPYLKPRVCCLWRILPQRAPPARSHCSDSARAVSAFAWHGNAHHTAPDRESRVGCHR